MHIRGAFKEPVASFLTFSLKLTILRRSLAPTPSTMPSSSDLNSSMRAMSSLLQDMNVKMAAMAASIEKLEKW
jgi:hypothetical protein